MGDRVLIIDDDRRLSAMLVDYRWGVSTTSPN